MRTAWIFAAALAGCMVNGKPVGFGGTNAAAAPPAGEAPAATSTSASGEPATASPVATGSTSASCAKQSWSDPWPYVDRPTDPWRAVVDGKPAPVAIPTDRTGMIGMPTAICDAAHDHCLRDCTWLVVAAQGSAKDMARPHHVDPSGAFVDLGGSTRPQPGFTAYRTVPVTKQNLAVGAVVMAVRAPAEDAGGHRVGSGDDASYDVGPLDAMWDVGTVESIAWSDGVLRMVGRREAYFLSATRLPVLQYEDGGTVTVVPGTEARAPAVAEVIAPGRTRPVSDPWAQVGAKKQPLAAEAGAALTGFSDTCTAAVDHCLRPWVWFVVDGRHVVPARWTGKTFARAYDGTMTIDQPGVAYRTRPARAADLVPGKRVLVYDSNDPPGSQSSAHRHDAWIFADVSATDRGTFITKDSDRRYPIGNARVLVLYWLPGEDAAAVE